MHQQPREKRKSMCVNWQQPLQAGILRSSSAVWLVTLGPLAGEVGGSRTQHSTTTSGFGYVLRWASAVEITDVFIFRNRKSGTARLSPFAPYKSPLKSVQVPSLDSASGLTCVILFSPSL